MSCYYPFNYDPTDGILKRPTLFELLSDLALSPSPPPTFQKSPHLFLSLSSLCVVVACLCKLNRERSPKKRRASLNIHYYLCGIYISQSVGFIIYQTAVSLFNKIVRMIILFCRHEAGSGVGFPLLFIMVLCSGGVVILFLFTKRLKTVLTIT
jgi:hypothetical protein